MFIISCFHCYLITSNSFIGNLEIKESDNRGRKTLICGIIALRIWNTFDKNFV